MKANEGKKKIKKICEKTHNQHSAASRNQKEMNHGRPSAASRNRNRNCPQMTQIHADRGEGEFQVHYLRESASSAGKGLLLFPDSRCFAAQNLRGIARFSLTVVRIPNLFQSGPIVSNQA
jgi:hypothetical protein